MAREHRDVVPALPQRRQAQPDHVEPVIQILPEQALLHARVEVLVRRRDDAHVGRERSVATHAIELAVGEHAQQARLQIRGHVADLVEEKGAAFGLLEAPAAHRLRAGEGAALVAEELAFEQVLRNGRRIDRDEGALGARTVAMQRARDELLAGARFPRDQHRRMGMGEPPDRAEHFLHGGGLAQDLGRLGVDRGRFHLAAALGEGAAHQLDRVIHVKRFGEVFEGAALEGGHRALQVGVRGHDDDRRRWQAVPELAHEFEP